MVIWLANYGQDAGIFRIGCSSLSLSHHGDIHGHSVAAASSSGNHSKDREREGLPTTPNLNRQLLCNYRHFCALQSSFDAERRRMGILCGRTITRRCAWPSFIPPSVHPSIGRKIPATWTYRGKPVQLLFLCGRSAYETRDLFVPRNAMKKGTRRKSKTFPSCDSSLLLQPHNWYVPRDSFGHSIDRSKTDCKAR